VKRLLWTATLGLVVAVGLAISRAPVDAHHASAPFYDDTKEVEAVGTVERFVFRNPHSFLFINAENSDGEIVEWEVELGAAVSMRRQGWTPETIRAGDGIRAVGNPSRAEGTFGICCAQLTAPDGSPIRP
jgi:hypothetical protein